MSKLAELVDELIAIKIAKGETLEDIQIYFNGLDTNLQLAVAKAIYHDDQDEWQDFMVNIMEHEDFGMSVARFMFEDADNWLYNVILQSIKDNPRFVDMFENEVAHQISNMLDKDYHQ